MSIADLAADLQRAGVGYVLVALEHSPYQHVPHDPSQERKRYLAAVKPVADFAEAAVEQWPWFEGLIKRAQPVALPDGVQAKLRTMIATWWTTLAIDWERGPFFQIQGELAWNLAAGTLLVHICRWDSRGDSFETDRYRYRREADGWLKTEEILTRS
jgi:hypothetical protein